MSTARESQDPVPPDATYVRQRWISRRRREWAEKCNTIMLEHGAVEGPTIYDSRHRARWGAQSLIRLLVDLRLHERWELSEHVEKKGDGWMWTVEWKGRHG